MNATFLQSAPHFSSRGFAAFIDEAVADVVKRMESDMSDIGQIALEALRDIDGKVIVETMSPEFVSFLGDVYRSLKFDK